VKRRRLHRRYGHAGAYVFEFEHDGHRVVVAHDAGAVFLPFEARIYARRRVPGRLARVVATYLGSSATDAEEKAKKAIDGGLL